MSKKQRDIYQVWKLLEKRYGVGDLLRETFLDHECIHTLETLLSYGPNEVPRQEFASYEAAAGNTDLEAARFGAYATFLDICAKHGIDGRKAFDHFSEASSYWGHNLEAWEEIERAGDTAASYEHDGMLFLKNLRKG